MIQASPPSQTANALKNVLEALFIVGVIINFVKLGDLLLRPHQQKWLQDKCDTLALWLDYARPLNWYVNKNIGGKTYVILFALLPAGMGLRAIVVRDWQGLILIGFVMFLIVLGSLILYLAIEESQFLREPVRLADNLADLIDDVKISIFKEGNLGEQLVTHFVFIIVTIIVTCIGSMFIWYWVEVNDFLGQRSYELIVDEEYVITWAGVLYYLTFASLPLVFALICILLLLVYLSILSFLVIVLCLTIAATELLLKFVRGAVWRVTEYDKGAFAAILLVLTAALGIADVYLRFIAK